MKKKYTGNKKIDDFLNKNFKGKLISVKQKKRFTKHKKIKYAKQPKKAFSLNVDYEFEFPTNQEGTVTYEFQKSKDEHFTDFLKIKDLN